MSGTLKAESNSAFSLSLKHVSGAVKARISICHSRLTTKVRLRSQRDARTAIMD